jgi:foldase protein PrsA
MAFDFRKSFSNIAKKLKGIQGKGNKKRSSLTYIISGVVAAFVVFLVVMSIGIYRGGWEDNFTLGVSKVLPFPATFVNGHYVSYNDYLENLNIMKKYQTEFKKVDFKSDEGKKILSTLRKDTLDRLNEDVLVKNEAVKLKVTISKKDVDDSFNDLIKSNGGEKAFAEVLQKYYGLSVNQFKKEIYQDRLLRQKVADKFANDESVNSDAKKLAEDILAKVRAGEDFATLAKQYSKDPSAANGGDLGFFSKGKMVPEFEQAAFGLKVGEVSNVVKSVYGYHIIKLTEIKGDQIKASHILIKTKDFNTWLEDAKKAAKINRLVRL